MLDIGPRQEAVDPDRVEHHQDGHWARLCRSSRPADPGASGTKANFSQSAHSFPLNSFIEAAHQFEAEEPTQLMAQRLQNSPRPFANGPLTQPHFK
jgi:hypothetical protein